MAHATKYGKIPPMRTRARRALDSGPGLVAVLAYDGLCTFEFGIAVEIFGLPRPELGPDWYRFSVCSLKRGPVRATAGVSVKATHGLSRLARAGTIIIPGWSGQNVIPPARLVSSLRKAHESGARLVSICSGV